MRLFILTASSTVRSRIRRYQKLLLPFGVAHSGRHAEIIGWPKSERCDAFQDVIITSSETVSKRAETSYDDGNDE